MALLFVRFLADESGLAAVDYALVIGIVSVSSLVAWDAMGGTLQNIFNGLSEDVKDSL